MHAARALLAVTLVAFAAPTVSAFAPVDAEEFRTPAGDIISLYAPLAGPSSEAPDAIARAFLAENAAALGIPDVAALEKTSTHVSLAATHHRFQQVLDGIPVVGAEVSVHILHDGRVWAAHSNAVSGAADATPILPEAAARAVALAKVQGSILDARKVLLAKDGVGVPAWQVHVRPQSNPYTVWTVTVDRATGSVLESFDNAQYASASGSVWTDPVRASGNADLRGDALGTDRVVDLSQYRFPVTVDNLVADGVLSGPWVNIMEAVRAGPDYHVDRLDPRFEEFQSYYWIDYSQKYIQSLGYVGEKGIVHRPIDVYPHAQVTIHNAFYLRLPSISTAAGDVPPKYGTSDGLIAFGWRAACTAPSTGGPANCDSEGVDPGVYAYDDVGESADVILHEYGHATQDSMVPGFRGLEGLGEGWSDYWAATQLAPLNNTHFDTCIATWFGAHLWPVQDNKTHCIRNLDNNVTYEDIEEKGVHFSGQLISGAMWNLRSHIGDNASADRLFLEANFLMPAAGKVAHMAESIVMADIALNNGTNTPQVVDEFKVRQVEPKLPKEVLRTIADVRSAQGRPPVVTPMEEAETASSLAVPAAVLVLAGFALLRRRR